MVMDVATGGSGTAKAAGNANMGIVFLVKTVSLCCVLTKWIVFEFSI
jgi:hypothetical protein